MSSFEERLARLEARVAVLEGAPTVRTDPQMPGAPDGTGHVVYGGEASLGGHSWSWLTSHSPGRLIEQPAAPPAAVLAAAGHPARMRILQLLIVGPRPIADLQSALRLASQGQLYHHLKTLTSAGLVEQPERGVYGVPSRAVFPVLALAAAAADVAAAPA